MIVVDRLRFSFEMNELAFAQNLYAEWESFCRNYAIGVINDYLSSYDLADRYLEIERLSLDLGDIMQENFFEEFPQRLRAQLERQFRVTLLDEQVQQRSREQRIANTLHFLKNGYSLKGWQDQNFDLCVELRFIEQEGFSFELMRTLLFNSNAAKRVSRYFKMDEFSLQTSIQDEVQGVSNAENEAWRNISKWLSLPTLGRYEKMELLARVLQENPYIVTAYIHHFSQESELFVLADILASSSVRQIIYTESESHAEVDVPAYWYNLYIWLFEHYPFNGVATFGDKQTFKKHLNLKLLTFINKRAQSTYLTKSELTLQFILEIFGREHYLNVLRAIYNNQILDSKGQPASGDYYAWEIYYLFLKFSILEGNGQIEGRFVGLKTDFASFSESIVEVDREKSLDSFVDGRWQTEGKSLDFFVEGRAQIDGKSLDSFVEGRAQIDGKSLDSIVTERAQTDEKPLDSLVGGRAQIDGKSLDSLVAGRTQTDEKSFDSLVDSNNQTDGEYFGSFDELNRLIEGGLLGSKTALAPSLEMLLWNEQISTQQKWGIVSQLVSQRVWNSGEIQAALSSNKYSYMQKRGLYLPYLNLCSGREIEFIEKMDLLNLLNDFVEVTPREIVRALIIRLSQSLQDSVRVLALWFAINCDMLTKITEINSVSLLRKVLLLVRRLRAEGGSVDSSMADRSMAADADKANVVLQFIREITQNENEQTAFLQEIASLAHATDQAVFNLLLCTLRQYRIKNFDASSADIDKLLYDKNDILLRILSDRGVDRQYKSELLKRRIATRPTHFLQVLKPLLSSDVIHLVEDDILDREDLLILIGSKDSSLALLLLEASKIIEQNVSRWGIFKASSFVLSLSISKALLLFVLELSQDQRSLSREDALERFVSLWHFVLTKEKLSEGQDAKWQVVKQEILSLTLLREERFSKAKQNVLYKRLSQENFAEFAAWLLLDGVSDTTKSEVLRYYLRSDAQSLLHFIRWSFHQGTIKLSAWRGWIMVEDLVFIASTISYSMYEVANSLVQYVKQSGSISFTQLLEQLLQLFVSRSDAQWQNMERQELTKEFARRMNIDAECIESASLVAEKLKIEQLTPYVPSDITPALANETEQQASLEYISTSGAGLALLSPWFPRLFSMLGLLEEDKKSFVNEQAKIRAVFILQNLVSDEQREWREGELAFNRILVGLAFTTPLPPRLELTSQEQEASQSMLQGVKANWSVMKNTSIKGFQGAFIHRPGSLEMGEEQRWQLRVEHRSYDMLLDSIPWSYHLIRLPWMQRMIEVNWRTKQEFDN